MHFCKSFIVILFVPILVVLNIIPAAYASEMRCGWIVNPTPANWWLTDADGEWLIGAQGGFQAEGLDNIGDLTEGDWVVTNGSSYGYGCACLSAETDRARMTILRINSFRQLPLARCRADKKLPKR